MKRILFLLLTVLVVNSSFAQMKFTQNGFENVSDASKKYVVIEIEGKNQTELYKNALLHLNKKYVDPKEVLSLVDGESITVNGVARKAIRRTEGHRFDMNYTINLMFKDGKIRFEPTVNKITTTSMGKHQEMVNSGSFSMDGSSFNLFKKKGEINLDKAVLDVETYFSEFIKELKESDAKKAEW